MQKRKNSWQKALAMTLCVSCVLSGPVPTFAAGSTTSEALVNFAKGCTVTANVGNTSNMQASKAVDGDLSTRWSTEAAAPAWLQVDLGAQKEIKEFRIASELSNLPNQLIGKFKIEGSNDGNSWTMIHNSADKKAEGFTNDFVVTLDKPVTYRHVKITIESLKNDAYPSVSLREFEVRGVGTGSESGSTQDPTQNVAKGKQAVASSIEADSVKASNAVDGNTKDRNSRWGSNRGNGPHWIYVDLEKEMDVQNVRIFWETRKATNYKIQTATTLSTPMKESDWTDAKAMTTRPSNLTEVINLGETPKKARYVRLLVNAFDEKDPDKNESWNTISIYEMEVYGGAVAKPEVNVKDLITVTPPAKTDKKLTVNIPESDKYTITYNGTDYEEIVDEDLTIYQPVVDTTVNVSFKIVNKTNANDYEFKEIPVTIPGTYKKENGDNATPDVLPEVREWKGHTGTFAPTDASRIVIKDASLKKVADEFAADYKDITGKNISVVTADTAKAGDFFLALTTDKTKGLKKEGYLMTIADQVSVEAEDPTGAYWSTRTILQSLKNKGNLPKGITRDYPLYKVRGFILDVGRKTFTIDWLRDAVKQMSWYKLNDFQVHLNDNLIPLEHYNSEGADRIMQAYSGFRLESDIKEGGNGGKNKADLTSKDVFYTKKDFRDLIENARVCGVNIVPEIDTPAHSLALTKVRPDLRQGFSGRQNDHLDLIKQYDESLAFVQSIFNEYMTTENPVFDQDTIVHVGADEYGGSKKAYREFCNDMFKFVQDKGRKVRVWGSLTSMTDDKNPSNNIEVRGDRKPDSRVEMNLWNSGWANMKEMYNLGFDLINSNDGTYYIVPNAGYYYDYLNLGTMYNAKINKIGDIEIPAGDKQMLGGAFAVWNDMTDYLENGVSEYDVLDRIDNEMALFGAKLWGKGSKSLDAAKADYNELGDAPRTSFRYEAQKQENGAVAQYPMDNMNDTAGNGANLQAGKNAATAAVDFKNAMQLKGKESYVTTGLGTVGLGNSLRVKVKRTSNSKDEQILFESSYGSIKAVQKGTGNVGFTRENRDYSFQYELPLDEWVELEFKNEKDKAHLYVNGQLKDTIGDDEKVEGKRLLATMMFPVERIGSKTNAFVGYVDDIRIGTNAQFVSTMDLEHKLLTANTVLAGTDHQELKDAVAKANEVFRAYAPTQEAVDQAVASVDAVMKNVKYEKADYSRVDTYLSLIPEDTSMFTAKSVAWLQSVAAQVRRDVPKAMQSTVDGYEAQLANALNSLVLKEKENANYVNPSTLKATASSKQGSDGADKAIDGDPNTMWHTDWGITTMPHWIQFEMSEPTAVNGLTYLPRQTGNNNGTATKYEIQISDDGVTFRKHKEGTLELNHDEKVIPFDKVTTKFVRFVYIEAGGNNGSAAEIKIHQADVPADIAGLNVVIKRAESINNAGFTKASWDALQTKIAEAKTLAGSEKPDPEQVEVMKCDLSKCMAELVLEAAQKPETEKPETGKPETEKPETGKPETEKPETEKPQVEVVDKTDAQKYYNECLSYYKETAYTKESWSAYADAMAKLKAGLANDKITKEELNGLCKSVEKAAKALVAVTEQETPVQKPDKNETPVQKPNKNDTVATGDQASVLPTVLLMAGCVTILSYYSRKKREED